MNIEQLEKEAMKLSPDDRESLGLKLLASIDREFVYEAEWIAEVERRAEQLRNGEVEAIPAEEVFREARERLKRLK